MKNVIPVVCSLVLGCESKGGEPFSTSERKRDEVAYFFEKPLVSGSGEGGEVARNPWLEGSTGGSGSGNGSGGAAASGSGGAASARPGLDSGGGAAVPEPPKPPPLLFLSGYEETVSAHKYLMLENEGRATSPGECEVWVYSNGGIEAGRKIAVPSLGASERMVLCTTGAPSGPCNEALGSAPFNGDDALAVRCLDNPVDVFGRIGEDPGNEWSEGELGTKDTKLVRCARVPRAPDAVFPLAREWALWPGELDYEAAKARACPHPSGEGGTTGSNH